MQAVPDCTMVKIPYFYTQLSTQFLAVKLRLYWLYKETCINLKSFA